MTAGIGTTGGEIHDGIFVGGPLPLMGETTPPLVAILMQTSNSGRQASVLVDCCQLCADVGINFVLGVIVSAPSIDFSKIALNWSRFFCASIQDLILVQFLMEPAPELLPRIRLRQKPLFHRRWTCRDCVEPRQVYK